jgi:hypothetical protein
MTFIERFGIVIKNMIFWIFSALLFAIITYLFIIPWLKFRLYAWKMPPKVNIHPFIPVIGNAFYSLITRGNITHLQWLKNIETRYDPDTKATLTNIMRDNFLLLFSPEVLSEFYRNLEVF